MVISAKQNQVFIAVDVNLEGYTNAWATRRLRDNVRLFADESIPVLLSLGGLYERVSADCALCRRETPELLPIPISYRHRQVTLHRTTDICRQTAALRSLSIAVTPTPSTPTMDVFHNRL
nr:hypothetical protein [Nocardia barduliensis]